MPPVFLGNCHIGRCLFYLRRLFEGSAVIYSMTEAAKANGLDPYCHLTWVLSNAPILADKGDGWAAKLLPANVPADCHALQQIFSVSFIV